MNRLLVPAFLFVLLLAGAGCSRAPSVDPLPMPDLPPQAAEEARANVPDFAGRPSVFPGVLPMEELAGKRIRLVTEKGDIVFELYPETAPRAVSNFVGLSLNEFFDGLTFHRREEGFVIQGGDPSGNGTGGPGYTFKDELVDAYSYERGVVAMANRGSDTNGSQFFIMLGNVPLPKAYTIFGRVTEGMDVVDQIEVGDKILNAAVE